jgi:hypothetical protein
MDSGYYGSYYPGNRTHIDWNHVQFSNFSNIQYSRPDFSDTEDQERDEYQGEYTLP